MCLVFSNYDHSISVQKTKNNQYSSNPYYIMLLDSGSGSSSDIQMDFSTYFCYKANSYAVGLGGSKLSISDPQFIRRDVSGYLPYRQLDRVCGFVFVLFLGAFDTWE